MFINVPDVALMPIFFEGKIMKLQSDLFDEEYPEITINKKIRMITLFSGYDSQCMAMQRIGADFEIHRTSEWQTVSTNLMKQVFHKDDNTDYSASLTDDEVVEKLLSMGVSIDDEKPADEKILRRKGNNWCRNTYNNFRACKNLGSITNFHGEDLEITDKDKYFYMMFYSFPCQDLSIAGKQKGMTKGAGTRSGLLFEVERLLLELRDKGMKEKGNPKAFLPDCLCLENVVQLHSAKNMPDFQAWINSLNSLGYTSIYQDCNAKFYGIPQNRDRTFMMSILGNYDYSFPEPINLEYCMADVLEDEVDKKYFIDNERADNLIHQLITEKKIPEIENEE